MKRSLLTTFCCVIVLQACSSALRTPEDAEWLELTEAYSRIEATRAAFQTEGGTRRDRIAAAVSLQRQLEPVWVPFMSALENYYRTSGDPRAAALWVREKLLLGDGYAYLLARYDRAIEVYLSGLELDPGNPALIDRIKRAWEKAFVQPSAFNSVSAGMREYDVVDRLGYPRVDWMRQVVRSGRIYQAWIYPRSDGGAAAVYFEDGRVYHKNWQAAPANGGGGR